MGQFEWEKYWKNADLEEKERLEGEDPVTNRFSLRRFVSNSSGRNRRPRRRPRDVDLVIDHDTGRAYQLSDVPTRGLDAIVQSLLGHLFAVGEDPWPEFLRRLGL
jgi:hypothetical protein